MKRFPANLLWSLVILTILSLIILVLVLAKERADDKEAGSAIHHLPCDQKLVNTVLSSDGVSSYNTRPMRPDEVPERHLVQWFRDRSQTEPGVDPKDHWKQFIQESRCPDAPMSAP